MSLTSELSLVAQTLTPGHLISRAVGRLATCEIGAVKNTLIDAAIRRYGIDLEEALLSEASEYPHFNAFFTRALKPDARPLAGIGQIAAPADGQLLAMGDISETLKIRAKGHDFSLSALLGSTDFDDTYRQGQFLTTYLSPKDYHRVHCPLDGELMQMTHVPGRLFSVSLGTVTAKPQVFARNERVVLHLMGADGPFALVLVGAMLVASIETPFAGLITPPGRQVTHWQYAKGTPITFKQGDEVGRFQFGSTVILVIPKGTLKFHDTLTTDQVIRMGESLGSVIPATVDEA